MSGLWADFFKRLMTPPDKAAKEKAVPVKRGPAPKKMTPERQALIDEAMNIYRDKQTMLAELPPIQREALLYMAMKTFFNVPIAKQADEAPKHSKKRDKTP